MPVLARYSSALRATLRGSRRVGLQRQRVVHEEVAGQRLALAERVEPRGGRRPGSSVMSDSWIDWKPGWTSRRTPCRRPANRLVDARGRDGEVIHDAGQVAEPDVEVLDLLVRDVLEYLFGVVEHAHLLLRSAAGSSGRYGRGVARRSLGSFQRLTGITQSSGTALPPSCRHGPLDRVLDARNAA